MRKEPLISINLPTYNGVDTVERALKSVKAQTYKNYEIVVVDHYSKDGTIEIVKKYTNIILFLSCDQVLAPDLLERTVKYFNEKDVDMIINEERTFNPKTFIEKLTDIDRRIVHDKRETDPTKSVLLPSTFKKEIL